MCSRMIAALLSSLLLAAVSTPCVAQKLGEPIQIFNGAISEKTQVEWKAIAEDPASDAAEIWEVRDDILVIKAGPRGYLRTQDGYANFVLKLQWRRPEGKKAGRGGILVRMTGDDKIWPKSLEAQLNAGGAGDFWGLGGYALKGPAERFQQLENETLGTLTNVRKERDAEKPVGQWNDYEIVAQGDTVTLKINHKVVNQATGCDVVKGKICLTAEGDEIHFRNIELIPILD